MSVKLCITFIFSTIISWLNDKHFVSINDMIFYSKTDFLLHSVTIMLMARKRNHINDY